MISDHHDLRGPVHVYRDGIRIGRWAFQIRTHWFPGLVFGVEWKPGPWKDEPKVHFSWLIYFGFVKMSIEHIFTVAKRENP